MTSNHSVRSLNFLKDTSNINKSTFLQYKSNTKLDKQVSKLQGTFDGKTQDNVKDNHHFAFIELKGRKRPFNDEVTLEYEVSKRLQKGE